MHVTVQNWTPSSVEHWPSMYRTAVLMSVGASDCTISFLCHIDHYTLLYGLCASSPLVSSIPLPLHSLAPPLCPCFPLPLFCPSPSLCSSSFPLPSHCPSILILSISSLPCSPLSLTIDTYDNIKYTIGMDLYMK